MARRATPHLALTPSLLLLAAAASPLGAQTNPARPGEIVHKHVTSADFGDEPIRLESVGLTMRVPLDATIQTSQAGPATTIQIKGPDSRWLIVVSTARTSPAIPDPTRFLDRTLIEVMGNNAIKDQRTGETIAVKGAITSRTPNFSVPGSLSVEGKPIPGERVSLSMPSGPSGSSVERRTFTVFQPAADALCIIELLCPDAEFAAASRLYELTVATAEFADPSRMAESRRSAVLTGIAFLSALTPEAYAKAAEAAPGTRDSAQWFRIFHPGLSPNTPAADTEEVGYRSIRIFKGTRTQIDRNAAPLPISAVNPEGYLVEIGARQLQRNAATSVIGDPAALTVYDVRGIYFVSVDRLHETWSLSTAVREAQGKPPAIFTETGTRDGKQMTILVNAPGKPTRTIKPTVPPDGYLNQAEVYMLPRLAAAAASEAELGFYAYHTASSAIVLRRDTFTRDPENPERWLIFSRPTEGSEPMATTLDSRGRTLRAQWPDNLVIEPMPIEEIERLWKSKGLPTGSIQGP